MQLRISMLTMGVLFLLTTLVTEARGLRIEPFSQEQTVQVILNLEENHFAVRGGCNVIRGNVNVTDQGIFKVEPNRMASTRMACPETLKDIDGRITKFMEGAPKIIRKKDHLFLVGTVEGESFSTFIPVDLDKGQFGDIAAKPYDIVFYYVSDEKAICKLSRDGRTSDRLCLQIRKEKNDPWTVLKGHIKGFRPEPNVEYRLRLKEYTREDNTKYWSLDMIVEQEIVKPEDKSPSHESMEE